MERLALGGRAGRRRHGGARRRERRGLLPYGGDGARRRGAQHGAGGHLRDRRGARGAADPRRERGGVPDHRRGPAHARRPQRLRYLRVARARAAGAGTALPRRCERDADVLRPELRLAHLYRYRPDGAAGVRVRFPSARGRADRDRCPGRARRGARRGGGRARRGGRAHGGGEGGGMACGLRQGRREHARARGQPLVDIPGPEPRLRLEYHLGPQRRPRPNAGLLRGTPGFGGARGSWRGGGGRLGGAPRVLPLRARPLRGGARGGGGRAGDLERRAAAAQHRRGAGDVALHGRRVAVDV